MRTGRSPQAEGRSASVAGSGRETRRTQCILRDAGAARRSSRRRAHYKLELHMYIMLALISISCRYSLH